MRIMDFIMGLVLILGLGCAVYFMGKLEVTEITPQSEFIWIDNNRLHVDSIIDCQPIYNETTEQIGSWIRVSFQETTVFIECLNTDDYEWMEYRDSFLDNFRGLKWN